MSRIALAAALPVFLLAACGRQEQAAAPNGAVDAGANALENESPADPGRPDAPVNGVDESVPPPDAVSHPNGYLPPAPDGTDPTYVNSSGSDGSPSATEDEYMHNKQSSR